MEEHIIYVQKHIMIINYTTLKTLPNIYRQVKKVLGYSCNFPFDIIKHEQQLHEQLQKQAHEQLQKQVQEKQLQGQLQEKLYNQLQKQLQKQVQEQLHNLMNNWAACIFFEKSLTGSTAFQIIKKENIEDVEKSFEIKFEGEIEIVNPNPKYTITSCASIEFNTSQQRVNIYNVCTDVIYRKKGYVKYLLYYILRFIDASTYSLSWLALEPANPQWDALLKIYCGLGFYPTIITSERKMIHGNIYLNMFRNNKIFQKFKDVLPKGEHYEMYNYQLELDIINNNIDTANRIRDNHFKNDRCDNDIFTIDYDLMNNIKTSLVDDQIREFSGELIVKNKKFILNGDLIIRGNPMNTPAYDRRYFFHTHPYICNEINRGIFDWPSIPDLNLVLNHKNLQFLFTNTGVYIYQLTHDFIKYINNIKNTEKFGKFGKFIRTHFENTIFDTDETIVNDNDKAIANAKLHVKYMNDNIIINEPELYENKEEKHMDTDDIKLKVFDTQFYNWDELKAIKTLNISVNRMGKECIEKRKGIFDVKNIMNVDSEGESGRHGIIESQRQIMEKKELEKKLCIKEQNPNLGSNTKRSRKPLRKYDPTPDEL